MALNPVLLFSLKVDLKVPLNLEMNKLVNGVDRDMKESNIKLERPKKKKSKTTRYSKN